MNGVDNTSYLRDMLRHFNNGLNSLSADIGISVKTLNDFMSGNASPKTIKLVERYLLQKVGAINNLMISYHEAMKGSIMVNEESKKLTPDVKMQGGIEVVYKWKGERGGEVDAEGIFIDDKHFIIKKGSKCTHSTRLELLPHKKKNNIRGKVSPLLRGKNPYLKPMGIRSYVFVRDYTASSASGGVSILHGYFESGLRKWVVKSTGETLGEYLGK